MNMSEEVVWHAHVLHKEHMYCETRNGYMRKKRPAQPFPRLTGSAGQDDLRQNTLRFVKKMYLKCSFRLFLTLLAM